MFELPEGKGHEHDFEVVECLQGVQTELAALRAVLKQDGVTDEMSDPGVGAGDSDRPQTTA